MESEEDCTIQLQQHHIQCKLGSDRKYARHRLFCDYMKSRNFRHEVISKDSRKNHIDEHGYSYFHWACMAGNVERVRRFISEGIDVNFDSWKCSPLHTAAQYRQKDIVQILLENGANPNQEDHQKSTPLHALAWMCLCKCSSYCTFCDYRKPVDEIVEMLVKKKANIEARNKHGDTPLQSAVCRFDFQLVKSLLKHEAKLDSLNEEKIFSQNFESIELKNYPLTLNIVEVIHLLQSAGYRLNFKTRFLMLKCWIKVRGNDTEYMIPFYEKENDKKYTTRRAIIFHIYMHDKYGFYYKQEAADYLRVQKKDMNWGLFLNAMHDEINERTWNCRKKITMLNNVKLNDDVSLYQLCKMNYSEGYSILKKMKDWHLHTPEGLEHCPMNFMVKRHVGNILIRRHLELFAADFFMTDHCNLNLPYLPCLKIAENMSDDDLLRLCEKTEEAN